MQLKAQEELGLNPIAPVAGEGKAWIQLQGKGNPTLPGEAYFNRSKRKYPAVGLSTLRHRTAQYLNLPPTYLPVAQILLVYHLLITHQVLQGASALADSFGSRNRLSTLSFQPPLPTWEHKHLPISPGNQTGKPFHLKSNHPSLAALAPSHKQQ